jgi:hypothetical protein
MIVEERIMHTVMLGNFYGKELFGLILLLKAIWREK